MAADNHTAIVGNLVEDPELRFTNTGIAGHSEALCLAGSHEVRIGL
jgi:single-stranded DNA-binding protein